MVIWYRGVAAHFICRVGFGATRTASKVSLRTNCWHALYVAFWGVRAESRLPQNHLRLTSLFLSFKVPVLPLCKVVGFANFSQQLRQIFRVDTGQFIDVFRSSANTQTAVAERAACFIGILAEIVSFGHQSIGQEGIHIGRIAL